MFALKLVRLFTPTAVRFPVMILIPSSEMDPLVAGSIIILPLYVSQVDMEEASVPETIVMLGPSHCAVEY